MNEKIQVQSQESIINQKNIDAKSLKGSEPEISIKIEDLIPGLPKFEKNYENKEVNVFKEDILTYLRERDKCIFNLINSYKDKIIKTESNYLELTKRLNNNYSDVLSSQVEIHNRLDGLNGYDSFLTKTNDQLISHEIRINNLREDFQKSSQKYDKIYLDNLELPGYIGKYAKYKNCQIFFEEIIKELNKLNTYKEKNILDLRSYKEKMELNIKTFSTLVDNNNKSQIKYINEMYEKNFKECKNMIDTLGEKITDIRVENSRYAVELIGKSINLTKEWDKIQKIKEEILKEFNEKIQDFKIVSNNTIDSFSDFKLEFNTIKNKFLELAEFIRDVRFRKNIGGDMKKREIKNITKKLISKKNCGKAIDKDKERILMDYNFKEKNNESKKSMSHELNGKIKNYIKGVTNVEELKQDSKIHPPDNDKKRPINKIEEKNNIKQENNMSLRKQKSNTVIDIVHNLRNLKKEKTDIYSEESDNSENNSLNNIMQTNYYKNNLTIEGLGSKKTNYGSTNSNSNSRFLFKDVLIDAEDKIINELASDLEQTNNKLNDNQEKTEQLQALINKIEPMNINMNINKIENLNYNSHKKIKEDNGEQTNDINKEIILIKKDNNPIEKIMINFDKKLTNIEVYTKEKISDIIAQIENLRQLFANTNKISKFPTNPLFKYPSYTNININTNKINNPQKMKEAHIVEIAGKILNTKIPKKYITNSNNIIAAKDKDKENNNSYSNRELNVVINKGEINLPKDISQRIKTGKQPTSIKTIINRTLSGINNTAIFSNMENDFNIKFLKGIEKMNINAKGINKNNFGEKKIY
jgi:hypothetical protein